MYTCRISVHELVETSYLQGSLTSQGMSAQRAQLGARIHRVLQSKRGKNYQSEVFSGMKACWTTSRSSSKPRGWHRDQPGSDHSRGDQVLLAAI